MGFASTGRFDPSGDNPLGALVSKDLPARVAYARGKGAASPGESAVHARAKWRRFDPTQDGGPRPTGRPLPELSACQTCG